MKYRLGKLIGRGGIGRVHECKDPVSGRKYAVKLVPVEGRGTGPDLISEFDVLSRIEHPNIIKVHDAGQEGAEWFMVMELIDGCDALDAPEKVFKGDLAGFLARFAELFDALDTVHGAGLAHGDIKPSNILFERSGRPVLVDFGMAAYYAAPEGSVAGATFKYAAPEIFEGSAHDGPSDLFSVGLVLYECLSGREIVRKGARVRLDHRHIPKDLRWIIRRLTEENPGERFRTAYDAKRALLETLHIVDAGEPFTGEAYLLPGRLVGRDKQIRLIERVIGDDSRTGSATIVLLGDAGSGKTRLVSEVKRRCIVGGVWFADLAAATGSANEHILRLAEYLKDCLRQRGEDLADHKAGAMQAGTDSAAGSGLLAVTTGLLVRRVLGHGKLVVSLGDLPGEDEHDAAGKRLMMEALGKIWDPNLILITTLDSGLGEPPSAAGLHVVEMPPLDDEEIGGVIVGALGGTEIPEGLSGDIIRLAQGSPGLARIILNGMVTDGRLSRGVGKWLYLRKRLRRAPAHLQEAYGDLITSLKPLDRKVLGILAHLSIACGLDILHRISGFDRSGTAKAILNLRKLGLVESESRAGRASYRVHPWVDAAARRGYPRRRAREIAQRAIGLFEDMQPVEDAALAGLHDMAGNHGESMEHSMKAASAALESRDFGNAVAHVDRALKSLKRAGASGSEAIEVLIAAGDVMQETSDFDRARSLYRRALLRSPDADKNRVMRKIGYLHEVQGKHHLALRHYAGAFRNAKRTGQTKAVAKLGNDLAWINMRLGRHAETKRRAEHVIELLEDTAEYGELSQAYSTLGVSSWTTSRWEDAIRYHRRCLELRQQAGDERGQARTLNNIGLVLRSMGRWDEAAKSFERSIEIKRSLGDRAGLAGSHLNLAFIRFEKGELDRAMMETGNAINEAGIVGDSLIYVEASGLAGEIRHAMGDMQGAEEILTRTEIMTGDIGAPNEACVVKRRRADLLLDMGREMEALETAGEALKLADRIGSRLEQACCLRTLALITGASDTSGGLEQLRKSEEVLRELKSRFELGRTLIAAARLNMKSDRARAIRAASEAAEIFDGISAKHELRKARKLLESLGVRAGRSLDRTRLETLMRVAKTVNSFLELDDLLEVILDLAIETTRAERGFILLAENGKLKIKTARNISQDKMETAREISESVVREVLKTGEPIISVDALADPRLKDNKSVVAFNIRSLVAVPLRVREEIVGAIYEDTRTSSGHFNRSHVNFLMAFADHAAVAMENARLYGELQKSKQMVEMENRTLRGQLGGGDQVMGMTGISPRIREVFDRIHIAKDSTENVLILGESGTGKEVAARAVHFMSSRREEPFVAVNCASIPRELLESELFGHERGAFTGAHKTKIGYFEAARRGTLLLDEIGEMDNTMQAKLLRVIETKEFQRLGSTVPHRCDIRIMATTNRNLDDEVRDGRFRSDLYFRLNIIRIEMPPLRDRREDIPVLVDHILRDIARENARTRGGISPAAVDVLVRYSWPGNVRELENCLRSAWATGRGGIITAQHLPEKVREAVSPPGKRVELVKLVDRLIDSVDFSEQDPLLPKVERELVRRMVEKIGQKQKSARLLGISKPTLYTKLAGG